MGARFGVDMTPIERVLGGGITRWSHRRGITSRAGRWANLLYRPLS